MGQSYVHPFKNTYTVLEYLLHPRRRMLGFKLFDEGNGKDVPNYNWNERRWQFCLLKIDPGIDTWSAFVQKAPLPHPDDPWDEKAELIPFGWGDFMCPWYARQGVVIWWAFAGFKLESATLFYHLAPQASSKDCKFNMGGKDWGGYFGEWHEDQYFCLEYKCTNHHTLDGDQGGPVYNPKTQKVVGMVVNVREWQKWKRPQLNLKLSIAVPWLNEMREKWAGKYKDQNDYDEPLA